MAEVYDKPQRETVELTVDEVEALKVAKKPPAVPRGKPPSAATVELTVEDLHGSARPPPIPKK